MAGYGDVATTRIYTHVLVEEPSQLDGHALILRLGSPADFIPRSECSPGTPDCRLERFTLVRYVELPLGGTVDLDDPAQSISALSDHAVTQRLTQLLLDLKQDDWTVLYILVALAAGFVIGRYRAYAAYAFQNRGEELLSRVALTHFCPPDYHLMNHVTLQQKDGTTQVDHILVSRFGVFVIETKDYKGWIFGDAKQPNWTQVLFKRKFRFQNPILQNFRHVRAVQGLLDFLPPGAVKSVVVFTGYAEFKTEIPQGVFSLSKVIEYLREQTVEVMSLNQMQFCVGRLETARLAISGQTDVEHAESLERRHGSAT